MISFLRSVFLDDWLSFYQFLITIVLSMLRLIALEYVKCFFCIDVDYHLQLWNFACFVFHFISIIYQTYSGKLHGFKELTNETTGIGQVSGILNPIAGIRSGPMSVTLRYMSEINDGGIWEITLYILYIYYNEITKVLH